MRYAAQRTRRRFTESAAGPLSVLLWSPRSNGIPMQWSSCDSDNWVAAGSYLAQQQLAAQGDSLANYAYK